MSCWLNKFSNHLILAGVLCLEQHSLGPLSGAKYCFESVSSCVDIMCSLKLQKLKSVHFSGT